MKLDEKTIQENRRGTKAEKLGKPKKELSEEEIEAIEKAYEEYGCNAIT